MAYAKAIYLSLFINERFWLGLSEFIKGTLKLYSVQGHFIGYDCQYIVKFVLASCQEDSMVWPAGRSVVIGMKKDINAAKN